jgi:hypothetical protein
VTVTGLPTDGSTVYVRLWTRLSGNVWVFNDYSVATVTISATPAIGTPASAMHQGDRLDPAVIVGDAHGAAVIDELHLAGAFGSLGVLFDDAGS